LKEITDVVKLNNTLDITVVDELFSQNEKIFNTVTKKNDTDLFVNRSENAKPTDDTTASNIL